MTQKELGELCRDWCGVLSSYTPLGVDQVGAGAGAQAFMICRE